MDAAKPSFQKYLFVCENSRCDGRPCCGEAGQKIRETLKDSVKAAGLASQVRVSRSGCLDVCADGPNVLLMPDNVWFKKVSEKDVPEIVKTASRGL